MNKTEIGKKFIQLCDFSKKTNPIWPFAAMILDENGNELIRSTDCAHISPLYHAESLAIHILSKKLNVKNKSNLTMITTAEPDVLSMSAIYWAGIVQEIKITRVYYAVSLELISNLWPFGINIKSNEMIDRALNASTELIGPIFTDDVFEMFQSAKNQQLALNKDHPAMGTLSSNVDDFYQLPLIETHAK